MFVLDMTAGFLPSSRHQLSLHYVTTDTGLVHRVVCLFTPQLLLVLTVSTHERMARLS